MRASSGKVAVMMPKAARIPPAVRRVARGAGRYHRVLHLQGGVHRGGAEPGADRDGGDGEQRDGGFQREDAVQHGEPGAGEAQFS